MIGGITQSTGQVIVCTAGPMTGRMPSLKNMEGKISSWQGDRRRCEIIPMRLCMLMVMGHNVGSDSVDFVDKKMLTTFPNPQLRWQRQQREQVVQAS